MAIQLTKQQQQMAAGGAVLLGVCVFLYVKFFWLPISSSRAELTDKIAAIETKISKAEAQSSRLKRSWPASTNRLSRPRNAFPRASPSQISS